MDEVIFLNLHRRYTNVQPSYGGFLGIYQLAAFYEKTDMKHKAFLARSWKENGY